MSGAINGYEKAKKAKKMKNKVTGEYHV